MAIKSSDQLTIVDLTDAYSVVLTNDSHVFLGDTSSVASTQSTTLSVIAMRGSERINATVGTITKPNGITVTNDGLTPSPTLTITATTAVATGGDITIPINVGDGVIIEKKFSYSIAFKGAAGATGSTGGKGDKGDKGDTGSPGEKGDKGEKGETGANGSNGADGADGADAITLAITSSGGTIFKNTAIATTLTAHVYKAGAEVTGAALSALGTIKWYKDGGKTPVETGATCAINAGDVTNKATYIATLEG